MSNLRAIIEDPDGGIIAKYYETPKEEHDFEIRPVKEKDQIHEIAFNRSLSRSKVENDVEEFFESIDNSYGDDFSVDMR